MVHPRNSSNNSDYVSGDLIIPDSVVYCGNTYVVSQLKTHNFIVGAFSQCSTLTSVYIPNTVKSIGEYSFTYCDSLKYVHLPDSITEILTETFKSCYSLGSITLVRCIENIYPRAFQSCTALTEIHSQNDIAPRLLSGAFYNVPVATTIFIPCGSTSSYVSEWGGCFSTFVEEPGFSLKVAVSDEERGSVEMVREPTCNDPQAELLAIANEGYHFEGWSITPGYQNIVTGNPLTIALDQDMSVIAYFAVDSTVGITLVDGGAMLMAYPNPFRQRVKIRVESGELKVES